MSIRTFNGRWLLVNGALASSDSCCCNNPPCSGPCDEENPCPEGCSCCNGECVPETCCGPCEENDDCDPGCKCEDGECVPIPCDECGDECVMFLHGRTGDGVISDPGFIESWGVFELTGFWGKNETWSGDPEDFSDEGYALSVGNITCEGGRWVIAEISGGGQVRTAASSVVEGITGRQTIHNYRNVRVIVDENGCPTGLELGDFDVEEGPNGPSIHTPLEPDIVIDCNPLP